MIDFALIPKAQSDVPLGVVPDAPISLADKRKTDTFKGVTR